MTQSVGGGPGVRILGQGAAAPARLLTNQDLEQLVDTSHEWIVQRTGIERRHIVEGPDEGEFTLARDAVSRAIASSGVDPGTIDLLIHASVSSEMTCPSNACRIAAAVGSVPAAAFDLIAACSGFLYGVNIAESLIRAGRFRTIAVVGCDALSTIVDYGERSVSVLFGDGAGAVVLQADPDNPERGCLYQSMGADGSRWDTLYMPNRMDEVPEHDRDNPIRLGCLRMNGREVYRFAVNKFRQVIEEALAATGLEVADVAQFICHQSNLRIIEAAKERLGLPDEKVHVNINEYGNTSAGSIGLVWNDVVNAGRVKEGDIVVFVAFGGGLTWASSVWRL